MTQPAESAVQQCAGPDVDVTPDGPKRTRRKLEPDSAGEQSLEDAILNSCPTLAPRQNRRPSPNGKYSVGR